MITQTVASEVCKASMKRRGEKSWLLSPKVDWKKLEFLYKAPSQPHTQSPPSPGFLFSDGRRTLKNIMKDMAHKKEK
jgi:hypothetical protein